MARRRNTQPTDRELEILHVLWDAGPVGQGHIRKKLDALQTSGAKRIASTTVATMLSVMLEKKLVRRRKGKRGYEWSATLSREEAAQGLVGQLLDRVFDGSAPRLVAHLVDAGDLSAAQLAELKQMLRPKTSTKNTKRRK